MEETREPGTAPLDERAEQWVDRYGDALFRYAVIKLGDPQLAEDIVQETFLAAIAGKQSFRNDATVSTWLFAILKRKVADHYRCKKRMFDSVEDSDTTECAGQDRRWGGNPATVFENREFQETFEDCVSKLPNKLAEVFMLREVNQQSPREIRELLGLSATNLSMRLHRSRMALRDCLNQNWFQEDG